MLGGYQTITFNNKSISVGSTITVNGIYDKIKNSNQKVILLGDLVIDGIPKNSMFVSVNYDGDNIVIKRYGVKFTIEPNDTISCDQFKVDPDFLPDGGFGYEDVENIGDTLTWDGTPTDTVVEAAGVLFSKVSDNTPSSDEVIGSHVTVSNGGEYIETEIVSSLIGVFNETVYGIGNVIIVASVDGAFCELGGETIVFPKKGIYFSYGDSGSTVTYITKLTIPNYNFTKTEVHKIDKKFLPDDIGVKVISLEAYGIDLSQLLTFNGGTQVFEGDNVLEFWRDIQKVEQPEFTMNFSAITLKFNPITVSYNVNGDLDSIDVIGIYYLNSSLYRSTTKFMFEVQNGEFRKLTVFLVFEPLTVPS